jgi:Cof subfamily protein (haloacid dehalogenase superfamily)
MALRYEQSFASAKGLTGYERLILGARAKALTGRTIAAVGRLADAGILFAIVSGRPPRRMSMLVEPLGLSTPITAFNGGLVVDTDMHTLVQRNLPRGLVTPIVDVLRSSSLDIWDYRGAKWYVQDPNRPHVAKESATVGFTPTVVEDYDELADDVVKIVGVSEDTTAVATAGGAARDRFGDHALAACSQPYYIDVTHPDANKGCVARYLAEHYQIPTSRIATIGDMPNDVLMFANCGLSIAMGNAGPGVRGPLAGSPLRTRMKASPTPSSASSCRKRRRQPDRPGT